MVHTYSPVIYHLESWGVGNSTREVNVGSRDTSSYPHTCDSVSGSRPLLLLLPV